MNTYVILFRGINVGGKNVIPMKNLAALLEKNGYSNVQTYIQSGNVVLQSSRRPEQDLGSLVVAEFGFSPDILILSEAEFTAAMANNPFPSKDGKAVHFYFCASKPRPDKAKIEKLKAESEEFHINENVMYLHAPDGIGRSRLIANVEDCLGVRATGRNLNTVRKLTEMIGST